MIVDAAHAAFDILVALQQPTRHRYHFSRFKKRGVMRVETARDDRSARRRTARRLGRQFVVTTALVAIGAVGSGGARAALAAAQAANTSAGVYSDAQSARGQSISEKSCESC